MLKRGAVVFLITFVLVSMVGFVISQDESENYQASSVDELYLESLRLAANLECLKDSHCFAGFQCVDNNCISGEKVDSCESVKLSTPISDLRIGRPINIDKGVITNYELPNLLADGEFVEVVDGKVVEYLYTPFIVIGSSTIEEENLDYVVRTDSDDGFIYKLKIAFSKNVDFSNKNIQGQILRVLGKEYVIGVASTNSDIYLISEDRSIKLEDGKKARIGPSPTPLEGTLINMIKDSEGKVAMIEVTFNDKGDERRDMKLGEPYNDPVFENLKLSFNYFGGEGASDIRLGGNCA
jgi:hypothetical protein